MCVYILTYSIIFQCSGELKIAEVVSRFSDVDAFITLLEELGFDFMDKVRVKLVVNERSYE